MLSPGPPTSLIPEDDNSNDPHEHSMSTISSPKPSSAPGLVSHHKPATPARSRALIPILAKRSAGSSHNPITPPRVRFKSADRVLGVLTTTSSPSGASGQPPQQSPASEGELVAKSQSSRIPLSPRSPLKPQLSVRVSSPASSGKQAPDELDPFRTLAVRNSQGRTLNSRLGELKEDLGKLPKNTLFLLDDYVLTKDPIRSYVAAKHQQENMFYWCILKWQMTSERRRLFHALYSVNENLQRAMYFHINAEGSFLNAQLYTWEWICFALLLWEEGGNIDFMLTSDFYVMLQSPSEMPERWERMSNYDFLFMAGSQDVKRANLTPQQYRSLLSISKQNIKIWPHPLSVKLAIQKSVIHTALAGVVREAGGFAEKIYKIDSVTSGLQYLASGYVIK
ncbi:hypothetical protein F5880DRAFT_1512779, partial [Lentinula raphanica]